MKTLGRNTLEILEDVDTADIFTEISRGIDKWIWFVEPIDKQRNSETADAL